MFYGPAVWDPVLNIAQIVGLQCSFYLTLGVLLLILVGPFDYVTLHQFFDWSATNVSTISGACRCLGWAAATVVFSSSFRQGEKLMYVCSVPSVSCRMFDDHVLSSSRFCQRSLSHVLCRAIEKGRRFHGHALHPAHIWLPLLRRASSKCRVVDLLPSEPLDHGLPGRMALYEARNDRHSDSQKLGRVEEERPDIDICAMMWPRRDVISTASTTCIYSDAPSGSS